MSRQRVFEVVGSLLLVALPVIGHGADDRIHLGVATCASSLCHGSAKPLQATPVLQDEYVTWSHFDPHARAWGVLLEERAQLIAKRLGIQKAEAAKECLGCHSEDVPAAQHGERFQLSDGVGCETCHGGAQNWLATHYDTPKVSHADNLTAGMYPLELPRPRAERCLECHLGAADRFASHKLMAAGHPRLSFELDTYTELWRTSGGHEHYRVDADYRKRKPVTASTGVWLAGLIVAAERRLDLLESPAFQQGGALPDFAFFDCYACHRAMGLKRWRERAADRGGEPGALRLDDSVLRLLTTAAASLRATDADALRRDTAALQAAVARDRAALPDAIAGLRRTLDRLQRDFGGADLQPAVKREVLANLLRSGAQGEYPDYASAEQLAMAITVLASDTGEGRSLQAGLDNVFGALSDDDQYDRRRFIEALRHLAGRQAGTGIHR